MAKPLPNITKALAGLFGGFGLFKYYPLCRDCLTQYKETLKKQACGRLMVNIVSKEKCEVCKANDTLQKI